VRNLLDGTVINNWAAEQLGHPLKGIQLVTADYTLTMHETVLLLKWLRQRGAPDVRFYLAQALLGEHIQSPQTGADIILIDAPPRLTTGAVNALVAGTHLIVPTSLDPLAAETVRSFLRQAWAIRTQLNQGLELAGVLGTMTSARPLNRSLKRAELDAAAIAKKGLDEWHANRHFFDRDIQDLAAISNEAGRRIAYDGKVSQMFEQFGDELCGRIGL
jgi:cellulose biosynthesis protein BcsQ